MNWLLPEYIQDMLPDEAWRIEGMRGEVLELLRLLRLPAGRAASAGICRIAADQRQPRHGSAHLQAGGPVERTHAGFARRHHAASGAHRRAPAQPPGCRASVLCGQCAAHPARRADAHARTVADRCRTVWAQRDRERSRSAASDAASAGAAGYRRRASRSWACRRVSRAGAHAPQLAQSWKRHCSAPCRARMCRPCVAWLRDCRRLCRMRCWPCRSSTAGWKSSPRHARYCRIAPEVTAALDELEQAAAHLKPLARSIGIDLAELRGYHYHSGMVFAAYHAGSHDAIALGGRYDDVGKSFGRARPATGFSMDLRQLHGLLAKRRSRRRSLPRTVRCRAAGGHCQTARARAGRGGRSAGQCGASRRTELRPRTGLRDGKWVVVELKN